MTSGLTDARGTSSERSHRVADDAFPQSERVLYSRSPLNEVICQVRFPTILRIESELPVAFQESIRFGYPLFERVQIGPPGGLPAEVSKMLGNLAPKPSYRFQSEDGNTTIVLSSDAISLTAGRYRSWEEFKAGLMGPLQALASVYQPSFFQRVGLRYQNVILRSSLDLGGCPWARILAPSVLGELSEPAFDRYTKECRKAVRAVDEDGKGGFLFQHGLADVEGQSESGYLLDFDFYTERKTSLSDAETILDSFNKYAGRAFRWCITPDLHAALRPEPV